jgi:hypothetical protein
MKVRDVDHGAIDTWCNSLDGDSYGCFSWVGDDTGSLEYAVSEMVYFWVEDVETH